MPPTKEAEIPRPRARPGLPASAMGCPSKVVTTFDGVPGILSMVAVTSPPVIEPTYMPMRSTMASVGCM